MRAQRSSGSSHRGGDILGCDGGEGQCEIRANHGGSPVVFAVAGEEIPLLRLQALRLWRWGVAGGRPTAYPQHSAIN
jgi:hypothetical protein